MAKDKTIPWFRIFTNIDSAIQSADSRQVGDALKLTFQYVAAGGNDAGIERNIADPVTKLIFGLFKKSADESLKEYADRVEDGKKGAAAKREKNQKVEEENKRLKRQVDSYQEKYGGDEPAPFASIEESIAKSRQVLNKYK